MEGVDESWELVTLSKAVKADNIDEENTDVTDNAKHIGQVRPARRNSF